MFRFITDWLTGTASDGTTGDWRTNVPDAPPLPDSSPPFVSQPWEPTVGIHYGPSPASYDSNWMTDSIPSTPSYEPPKVD